MALAHSGKTAFVWLRMALTRRFCCILVNHDATSKYSKTLIDWAILPGVITVLLNGNVPSWAFPGGRPLVLRSWQEIANYLHRGIRTVQRGESELGMPVHRCGSAPCSAVVAFQQELDVWVEHCTGPRAATDSSRRSLVVLNSWKEIASYMHRGVRTVQRWEASFGMPVRRIGSTPRSPVVAFQHELDGWFAQLRSTSDGEASLTSRSARASSRTPKWSLKALPTPNHCGSPQVSSF
jgi:hypothetical protein